MLGQAGGWSWRPTYAIGKRKSRHAAAPQTRLTCMSAAEYGLDAISLACHKMRLRERCASAGEKCGYTKPAQSARSLRNLVSSPLFSRFRYRTSSGKLRSAQMSLKGTIRRPYRPPPPQPPRPRNQGRRAQAPPREMATSRPVSVTHSAGQGRPKSVTSPSIFRNPLMVLGSGHLIPMPSALTRTTRVPHTDKHGATAAGEKVGCAILAACQKRTHSILR